MAILTIAVSIAAPRLSDFFRGRSLDLEARRLLALTRQGQSRAISEGIPVELWVDAGEKKYGLEAQPSYEPQDPRAVEFEAHPDLKIEPRYDHGSGNAGPAMRASSLLSPTREAANPLTSRHADLPRFQFLPDGSISDVSPTRLRLEAGDGAELWLVQTTNRLRYELRSREN